jgi:hypothetical protein
MKRQLDYTNISPFQLGLSCSIMMLLGTGFISTMLGGVNSVFWLLCGIPVAIGLCVQFFVSSVHWMHICLTFNFLLCSLTFGISLWVALVSGSEGNILLSTILALFLLTSAGYAGYQIARKRLNGQATEQASEYIQIAGRRIAWATINRIADRIAMFTPLLIAVGLNTGHMLSQQAIYWIFGGVSLFFSVLAAMGAGGAVRRVILTRQDKR